MNDAIGVSIIICTMFGLVAVIVMGTIHSRLCDYRRIIRMIPAKELEVYIKNADDDDLIKQARQDLIK